MWSILSKKPSVLPPPPDFGRGRWMTNLLSRRKSTNRISYSTFKSVDPAIQFTVENNKEDGAIPFLDTAVKPEADENLPITVDRKPTPHGPVPTVGQSPPPLSKI